eukprot:Plantae.Rhodophyta-Hildenbrandia_rubra.ctg3056.p1 GENE.Plantae.Rhodophyta-Hildenbrandia_rubra.ctg3056~~Plantae.Rhodophyta-Hildenbrandia_rubra.ctg3056.p1  ORF type:complete len:1059 (+),score=201.15 Plantae.Rhodophyta-Hildenbrandia_rubra.ctg3056:174-3350(+)
MAGTSTTRPRSKVAPTSSRSKKPSGEKQPKQQSRAEKISNVVEVCNVARDEAERVLDAWDMDVATAIDRFLAGKEQSWSEVGKRKRKGTQAMATTSDDGDTMQRNDKFERSADGYETKGYSGGRASTRGGRGGRGGGRGGRGGSRGGRGAMRSWSGQNGDSTSSSGYGERSYDRSSSYSGGYRRGARGGRGGRGGGAYSRSSTRMSPTSVNSTASYGDGKDSSPDRIDSKSDWNTSSLASAGQWDTSTVTASEKNDPSDWNMNPVDASPTSDSKTFAESKSSGNDIGSAIATSSQSEWNIGGSSSIDQNGSGSNTSAPINAQAPSVGGTSVSSLVEPQPVQKATASGPKPMRKINYAAAAATGTKYEKPKPKPPVQSKPPQVKQSPVPTASNSAPSGAWGGVNGTTETLPASADSNIGMDGSSEETLDSKKRGRNKATRKYRPKMDGPVTRETGQENSTTVENQALSMDQNVSQETRGTPNRKPREQNGPMVKTWAARTAVREEKPEDSATNLIPSERKTPDVSTEGVPESKTNGDALSLQFGSFNLGGIDTVNWSGRPEVNGTGGANGPSQQGNIPGSSVGGPSPGRPADKQAIPAVQSTPSKAPGPSPSRAVGNSPTAAKIIRTSPSPAPSNRNVVGNPMPGSNREMLPQSVSGPSPNVVVPMTTAATKSPAPVGPAAAMASGMSRIPGPSSNSSMGFPGVSGGITPGVGVHTSGMSHPQHYNASGPYNMPQQGQVYNPGLGAFGNTQNHGVGRNSHFYDPASISGMPSNNFRDAKYGASTGPGGSLMQNGGPPPGNAPGPNKLPGHGIGDKAAGMSNMDPLSNPYMMNPGFGPSIPQYPSVYGFPPNPYGGPPPSMPPGPGPYQFPPGGPVPSQSVYGGYPAHSAPMGNKFNNSNTGGNRSNFPFEENNMLGGNMHRGGGLNGPLDNNPYGGPGGYLGGHMHNSHDPKGLNDPGLKPGRGGLPSGGNFGVHSLDHQASGPGNFGSSNNTYGDYNVATSGASWNRQHGGGNVGNHGSAPPNGQGQQSSGMYAPAPQNQYWQQQPQQPPQQQHQQFY